MKKEKLLPKTRRVEVLKLNLGCGDKWKEQYPDYEGLDVVDFGQKYKVDVISFLIYVKRCGKYDEVMANHFLEHFNQNELQTIFMGVYNALKVGGMFKICVPHKDKEQSWVLSHKTFWNEYTFKILEDRELFERYGFGSWKIEKLVTNERLDIHCWLKKV